jgi:hypothetical protein
MNIKITVNININKKQKNYNNVVKSTFKQAYDNLRLIKLNSSLSRVNSKN